MHAYHCILEADIFFSECHMKQAEMHLSVKEHQGASGVPVEWVASGVPVFLPGESQGWGSLVGCHLWGRTESAMTEAT